MKFFRNKKYKITNSVVMMAILRFDSLIPFWPVLCRKVGIYSLSRLGLISSIAPFVCRGDTGVDPLFRVETCVSRLSHLSIGRSFLILSKQMSKSLPVHRFAAVSKQKRAVFG